MSATNFFDGEHFEKSTLTMKRRVDAHVNALPANFAVQASQKTRLISRMNAAPRVKLSKIFALVDEYAELRKPFVACAEECDSCCHMNVQITNVEAERIEKSTGKKAKFLRADTCHPVTKFAGVPCPFLVNRRCSIYEDRPLLCRSHASFDVDSYWCAPERMNAAELPMISITDAQVAVSEIAHESAARRFADIRDFFG